MRAMRFTDESLYIVSLNVKKELNGYLGTVRPFLRPVYIAALISFLRNYLYNIDADTRSYILLLSETKFDYLFDKEDVGSIAIPAKAQARTEPQKTGVDKQEV